MQREETGKDSTERDKLPDSRSRAAKIMEDRMQKRRRRASLGRLISYIIALIVIILLMLWLRRAGM